MLFSTKMRVERATSSKEVASHSMKVPCMTLCGINNSTIFTMFSSGHTMPQKAKLLKGNPLLKELAFKV